MALECSAYLAEKLTNQPVLKAGHNFGESVLEADLGRSKKYIFSTEGSSDIDVKVPSTSNCEILIWVHARTEEVQHCRQIVAINTVIVIENKKQQDIRRLWGICSTWCHTSQKRSWSVITCSRDLPGFVQSGFSKKTASLTRHKGKRERDGALSRRDYVGTTQKTART